MTSFERTARRIIFALREEDLTNPDVWDGDRRRLIQTVIDILIDEEPGRNDHLLEAWMVANVHKQLYPEDVFPANGLTPDAWAAKGCRLVADSIMHRILALQKMPCHGTVMEGDLEADMRARRQLQEDGP